MNKFYRSLVAGLAVIGLVGCGDDVTVTEAPIIPPVVIPEPVPVITVTVAPNGVTIPVGGTVQLAAAVSGATGATVAWSTSSAAVATVSGTGLVTGVAVGSAGITATATDAASGATGAGSATITVTSTQTTPATISINAVTTAAGAPVVLAAAAGQLNVSLNLDRGGENVQRVELLLDGTVVGSQNFSLLATKAQEAGAEFDAVEIIVIPFNSAAFDAVTGIPQFLNGTHVLLARVITAQNQQGTASPSLQITLANVSFVAVTVEVLNGSSANGPAGVLWQTGDLRATALPVVFAAGSPAIQQVVLTPSAGGLAAKPLTAAPFVATWAKGTSIAGGGAGSGNTGVAASGLTVGATSTVGGAVGPTGTSAALNFDTQAPTVPAVFVNPNGRLNGWVNDGVLFTALQTANVNGMITAASADAGVSAAGGAAISYAAKAAPGAIANALAAGDITDPTSLAPSNANAVCLVLFAIDGLGNRNSNPAGACAATTQSTTIGIDRFAPIINYDVTSMANMSRRNGASIGGEFVVTVVDTGTVGNSGMLAGSPVRAKVTRHDAANAAACVVGTGAGCAQTATGLVVTLPTVRTAITGLTTAGFYTYDATAFDAAGNSTPLAAMRTIVWDATAPALTAAQVSLATNFYNGGIPQQFVSLANDNLDVWTLQYQMSYAAAAAPDTLLDINFGTTTMNPFNATPLLNSNVSAPLNVPFFLRQIQVVIGNTPMAVGARKKPSAIKGTLTDQATNVDAGAPVTTAIPATSVVTGSATAFPGTGAQLMHSWSVTSASQTVGNGTGATVPLSRTLTAVASGPTATFNPPFTRVEFYIINVGRLNLIPCTVTLVTTDDGSAQGRRHTYSCVFTPGTAFTTGQIQAMGSTVNGDALFTANGAGPLITIQP